MINRCFALFLVYTLAFSALYTETAPKKLSSTFQSKIEKYIKDQIKRYRIPGISLAIASRQGALYAKGFGFADKENNKPATDRTVYRLGSISKVVTGTAAMQLVDKGLLNIKVPITEYLPEFSIISPFGPHEPITPLNLMAHYSGLPRSANIEDTLVPHSLEDIVYLVKDRSLVCPPNTCFSYSSLGITVLGRVLEKITSQTFVDYTAANLFKPLQMETATFANWALPFAIQNLYAQGYNTRGPLDQAPIWGTPGGGMVASARDISNFIQMTLTRGSFKGIQILRPETLQQMFTVQNRDLPHEGAATQGLTWFINTLSIPNAKKTVSHNGATQAFTSWLIILPENDLGIVLLSNIRNDAIPFREITRQALIYAFEELR